MSTGFIGFVSSKIHAGALVLALLLPGSTHGAAPRNAPAREQITLLDGFTRATALPYSFRATSRERWRRQAPGVQEVKIPSSADGTPQGALFFDPDTGRPRPLLVVLHSWSSGYLQNISIPYAIFAEKNGWAFIHPDHRGRYNHPESTNSPLSRQDVIDAVQYARQHADVDPSRIYLVGYSGSAMTALVLAAEHPDLWAGVVAWVPIYDLADWYQYNRDHAPERAYASEIAASCGGPPRPGTEAAAECRRRSPSAWLPGAGGPLNVYLAVGLNDELAPPDHSLRAFNDLAEPEDRIPPEVIEEITRTREVPGELRARSEHPLYARAGADVVLERASRRATVILFKGGHDIVYNAGLDWLSRQRRH